MRDHHPLTRAVIERLLDDDEVDQIVVFDNETQAAGGRKWLRSIDDGLYGTKVEVRRRLGNGIIYETWNEAWRDAVSVWSSTGTLVDLCICNNDIVVPDGMLGHLSHGLRSGVLPAQFDDLPPPDTDLIDPATWTPLDDVWMVSPAYRYKDAVAVDDPPKITPTLGTFRKGGIAGFCFMLKPELHVTRGWPFIDEQFKWYCGDGDLVQQMQYRGATGARVEGLPLGFQTRTTSHNQRNKGWVEQTIRRDMRNSKAKYRRGGSFPTWKNRWDQLSSNA